MGYIGCMRILGNPSTDYNSGCDLCYVPEATMAPQSWKGLTTDVCWHVNSVLKNKFMIHRRQRRGKKKKKVKMDGTSSRTA